ncbi:MAG: flavodoxin family protein [Candidatus Hermodarchaeota archaeon]
MKPIVVYYSRTGTTKKVAEIIASSLECNIEEIIDPTNRKGLKGWLRCGREAMNKQLAPIKELNSNLSDYDLIIIGTPVWGGNLTSPVRAFFSKYKDNLKEIALFSTHDGEETTVFEEMEEISGKKAIAILDLQHKIAKEEKYGDKLAEFIGKIRE